MFHNPNESARAGAVLLDAQVPGWAERIDLRTLNIRSGECCVLAQLTGVEFSEGYVRLGLSPEDTIRNGFFVVGQPDSGHVHAVYDALTDAWGHEVRQRIAA